MTENIVLILILTLIAAGTGFILGWDVCQQVCRCKNAEAMVADLTQRLEKASFKTLPPEAQLKKMAAVLNDAHKQITAVTKALVKPAK